MGFRSFQTRLLLPFLGLFTVLLLATLLVVHAANTANARAAVDDALEVGAGVFRRLVAARSERLVEAARLLSADFAFKAAYATQDRGTILSALENHRGRIGADTIALTTLDGTMIADTLRPEATGVPAPFAARLDSAAEAGEMELAALVTLDGVPYQMVAVPLLIPTPDAWICVGFRIDDAFARGFQRLALCHVSLVAPEPGAGWACFASTLGPAARADLPAALARSPWVEGTTLPLSLAGEEHVSLLVPLDRHGDASVMAVLQRSLPEALAPYLRLRAVLLTLFAGGTLLCAVLGTWVARSVSRPVLEVASFARRVEEGDYRSRLSTGRSDEIGRLAASFNHMAQGLEEKERVRGLLGKVVSPAVAQELLRSELVLGGEEREVTVLFADIRGFTTLSEGRSPGEVVQLLNEYLTEVSGALERAGGVVDKYIGDAVMALFGAPLTHRDDPARAVAAALEMLAAVERLNAVFPRRGLPVLRIGIGLHTDRVVAGNMGSPTRLNYTVIGDGVNLASRVEGLTKTFGVPVLASAETRRRVTGYLFREIERVTVRGRNRPVEVHQPLARVDEAGPRLRSRVERYHEALGLLRGDRPGEARGILESLRAEWPEDQPTRWLLDRIEAGRAAGG